MSWLSGVMCKGSPKISIYTPVMAEVLLPTTREQFTLAKQFFHIVAIENETQLENNSANKAQAMPYNVDKDIESNFKKTLSDPTYITETNTKNNVLSEITKFATKQVGINLRIKTHERFGETTTGHWLRPYTTKDLSVKMVTTSESKKEYVENELAEISEKLLLKDDKEKERRETYTLIVLANVCCKKFVEIVEKHDMGLDDLRKKLKEMIETLKKIEINFINGKSDADDDDNLVTLLNECKRIAESEEAKQQLKTTSEEKLDFTVEETDLTCDVLGLNKKFKMIMERVDREVKLHQTPFYIIFSWVRVNLNSYPKLSEDKSQANFELLGFTGEKSKLLFETYKNEERSIEEIVEEYIKSCPILKT